MNTRTKGIVFSLSSGLLFALMAVCVKICRTDISAFHLLFIRGVSTVLILYPLVRKELKLLFQAGSLPIWARSLFGGFSVVCYFWNIGISSLALAILLADLTPLFVISFGFLFLGIRVPLGAVVGAILTVLGVSLLGLPGAADLKSIPLLLGLAGSATAAGAYLSLKKATGKFSAVLIVWCFSLIMALLSLFQAGSLLQAFTADKAPYLIGVVVLSILAQVTMTKSYQYLEAHLAASLTLTSALWGIIFDAFALREIPNQLTLVAFGIIIFGLLMVEYSTPKKKH